MRRKTPVLVSLTFLMMSCGLDNPFKSDRYRTYQIKVDSLTVASPLAVSDTMRVGFHAWTGNGGRCSGFSHIDTTRIDLVGYKVSVWGKQDLRRDIFCPSGVPRMDNLILLEFYPPLRDGTWIFLVSQPDGSVLRKEAVVR